MNTWYNQRNAPDAGTYLCNANEIAEGEAREFRFGSDSAFAFRMFIYNDAGEFRAFRNACPHFNVPLNHEPGEFFSLDRNTFLCMTHFARFDVHSGCCVEGPCRGESLDVIPLRRDGDRLLIGDSKLLL